MGLSITIQKTNAPSVTEIPDDLATDLAETYAALADLPVTNSAHVDFGTAQEARQFVKIGKAWAESEGLTFSRRGSVKENPTHVEFRIYKPSAKK